MDDRSARDELSKRGGARDAISERYEALSPDSITVSWGDFVETVRSEDPTIEYVAAIQRALDQLDQRVRETDLYISKSAEWETRVQHELITEYAFAIPTREAISYLVDHEPLVELGAWNGYWAYEVDRCNGNITAYDIDPVRDSWYPVERADQDVLLSYGTSDTLFLCWPPVGGMAYESLLLHDGDVIYVGEFPGDGFKAFGDMRFFDVLEARYEQATRLSLPSHPGAKDELYHFRPIVR
jgi:hypothetical protein